MARRALQALPMLAFSATFGVFAVDKNREARTVLRSGRGLAVIGALVVGYIVLAVLLRRFSGWALLPPVALSAVVLGLAAWAIRPYYVDRTANRVLVARPVATPGTTGVVAAPQPTGTVPARDTPTVELLASGALRGIGHDASGGASLVRAGPSLFVRFSNFDIEGVPDPQVYLVKGNDVRKPGGVALGRLKGNKGDLLDYEVPAGTAAGPGWTVLVWCRAFAVPVANATQA